MGRTGQLHSEVRRTIYIYMGVKWVGWGLGDFMMLPDHFVHYQCSMRAALLHSSIRHGMVFQHRNITIFIFKAIHLDY
jgi:hypothetical protein